MTLLVVFGSTPDLAWQELVTLYPNAERNSPHTALLHDSMIDPAELMRRLGGATKIGRLVSVVATIDADTLVPILALDTFQTFGISRIDSDDLPENLLPQIKAKLGKHIRYVASSGELSAVVIHTQRVSEYSVFPYRGKFGVAVTTAVQDYEGWTKRDRGRPHADPRSGMLPPKVARMMVNLAAPGKILLDPFCGMGTILAEGILTGWNAIGSDQSADTVAKAQENLTWLFHDGSRWKLYVHDATHISDAVRQADAIVTEPFMGKPNISPDIVKDVVTGLEKLYIGCFKDWANFLKSGGSVVITLPKFFVGGREYRVKKVIDSCETLGYTVLVGQ